MSFEEFTEALHADVVINLGPKGRALSISEALALRDWFDRRQVALRKAVTSSEE